MGVAANLLDQEKRLAASAALRLVRSGMRLGLGSGSTVAHFITLLGEQVRAGALDVQAVAASRTSEQMAREAGIEVIPPQRALILDLAVDGADEIGSGLALIKGGGGALLREKVVASAARQLLIIADSSKPVAQLGRFPLPVEVVPFAVPWVLDRLQELGATPVVRPDKQVPEQPALTDQGLHLVDCHFPLIPAPADLACRLESIPGLVEHGLFLDMAAAALIARGEQVQLLRPNSSPLDLTEFTDLATLLH